MTRTILCAVFFCIVFAGIESAADAAALDRTVDQHSSHELHSTAHDEHIDSGDDSQHDDHYCHCNAHGAALVAIDIAAPDDESTFSHRRYDVYFTSLLAPPPLRPPNA
jgi:hypothetical protein